MDTALYLRISSDPADQRAGVDRQREDCQAEAARRGWRIVETLEDNDKSAFGGKVRPGYQQLVSLIERGAVKAVIADRGDRLHRDLGEYRAFTQLVRRKGVQVVLVRGGEWSLETASGRLSGTLLAVIAEHESDLKRERINRALEQRARAGLPANTRFRSFGFEADGVTVREAEADLIRAGVADLIAGRRSLTAIAKSWGRTTTGARRILKSPRLVGLRSFQGQTFDAKWPAIVDRGSWELVGAILDGKTRPARPRRHLLSGFAICGSCGVALRAVMNRGRIYYTCRSETCPKKVVRAADRLERYVSDRIVWYLESEDRQPQGQENMEATAEILRLEKRLADLDAYFGTDECTLPPEVYDRQRRGLLDRIDGARSRLVAAPVAAGLGPADDDNWQEVLSPWRVWWDGASLEDRRAILAAEQVTVRVLPTAHGRLPLDREAVEVLIVRDSTKPRPPSEG